MKRRHKTREYYLFTEIIPFEDKIIPERIPLHQTASKQEMDFKRGKIDREELLSSSELAISKGYISDFLDEREKIEEFLKSNNAVYGINIFKSKEKDIEGDSIAVEFLHMAVKQNITYYLTWYNPEEREMPDEFDFYEDIYFDSDKEYKLWVNSPYETYSIYYDSFEEALESAKRGLKDLATFEVHIFKREKEDSDDEYIKGKHCGALVKDGLSYEVGYYMPYEWIAVVNLFCSEYQKSKKRKEVKILKETEQYTQDFSIRYIAKFKEIQTAKEPGFYTVVFDDDSYYGRAQPRLISAEKKDELLKGVSNSESKRIKYWLDKDGKISMFFPYG